ncbi:MAG: four helix bundle protein [Saprospiraceae bacterium]|nr:four helix bundle protein [Saprospiraceae bacterium]MBK7809854.1 four helix bundle protein [Saprospiraceae bacterium]MBK9632035.1 four helix bundle protein [Saprospiraceae bacterium]
MGESIVRRKSFEFALTIIDLYKKMIAQNEYIISKQILKSGTSIGANIEEGLAGQSKRDFVAKLSIASKEARETRYWLLLLKESKLIAVNIEKQLEDIDEIIKLLTSIVKTSQKEL